MKALRIATFGNIEQLQLQDIPVPQLQSRQVLIKTAAMAVNPIDIKTRQGQGAVNHANVSLPMTLGWDVSGTVVACADDVTLFQPGDGVFGSVGFPGLGQTHAEYVAVDETHLAFQPVAVSHIDCAAAAMVGLTAWQALKPEQRLKPGARVLIIGASGGVGHVAVQIAAAYHANVFGSASQHNLSYIETLGVQYGIDYQHTPWTDYPHDMDVILDTVGGANTPHLLALLKVGGTLVTLLPAEQMKLSELARQQHKYAEFVLMHSSGTDMAHIARLLATGQLRATIAAVLPLSQFAQAHRCLSVRSCPGKVVLIPDGVHRAACADKIAGTATPE